MKINELVQNDIVDFGAIPPAYFLLGLLSAFENRFQAMADKMIGEISWKQFFAIICIQMCKEDPTINDLSDVLGSSHQNVKQILLKLESKGLVEFKPDAKDKRKQRVVLTKKCHDFCKRNDDVGRDVMEKMFAGIPEKDLNKTIQTIMKIESNMREE